MRLFETYDWSDVFFISIRLADIIFAIKNILMILLCFDF